MPPAKFSKKRTRNRADEALTRLRERWQKENPDKEWEGDSQPIVTPMLRAAEGGLAAVLAALRAHDDDDAQAFIATYDGLTASDRKVIPLEGIAFAAGLTSLRLAEIANTALFLYADMQHQLLVSSSKAKVLKSIIKAATDEVPITALTPAGPIVVGKTNGDVKAMELFGKISGQVPLPKNTVNNYTQNNFDQREERRELPEATHTWKYPEDRLKEIAAVVNPKALPAPATQPGDLIHFEQNRPMVFER